jgi:hypothetical protein
MEGKTANAALRTIWTPNLPFNQDRLEGEKVTVEIEWPTIEAFDLIVARNEGTAPMFHRLTRDCCVGITNFKIGGVAAQSGKDLVAIRSKGATAARSLSINIGSYIFEQSMLTEGEEKN